MDFKDIRDLYENVREKEKHKIIQWLEDENYEVLNMNGEKAKRPNKTGSGQKHYTSGNTIKEFDLSNWKWISVEKNNLEYTISLQAFNVDPKTRNRHILMDRIGIYVCNYGEYNAEECFEKMQDTGIDLPMTEEKFTELQKKIEEFSI